MLLVLLLSCLILDAFVAAGVIVAGVILFAVEMVIGDEDGVRAGYRLCFVAFLCF